MRRIHQFLLLAALTLGTLLLAPAPSYAQEEAAPEKRMETQCGQHIGLTNRIAGCIRETVDDTAARFFDQDDGFYKLVSRFIAGFMTLGMAIYGVMAAAGMLEKVGRDTLMFVVKVSFIAYFTLNADVMYRTVIEAMDAAGAVVVQVTPKYGIAEGATDFGKIQCYQAMQKANDTYDKPLVGPWLAMDCLIDTVFGIKPFTGTVNSNVGVESKEWFNAQLKGTGLQRGLIFFFFSGMKTSVLGLMLGVLGFIFMWGIISMIIKSLLTYIAGYIGIAFMMIISPLFIPLLLFRTTKEYFDKWVKLTISFAMQPILILLFISFAIAGVDLAVFSGDYSVMYRIAGKASRASDFSINEYLTKNEAVVSKPVTPFFANTNDKANPTTAQAQRSVLNVFEGKCGADKMTTDPDCAGMPIQIWRDSIDWKKLASVRDPAVQLSDGATRPEQQISREVLAAVIFCGVVIFVMNRLMAVVPHIIVDLIGDLNQTPNMYTTATGGWSNAASQMSSGISGSLKGALSSMTTQRGSP